MDAVAKEGNRAAMVLDRILLCNQTSERLQKYHIDHGVLQSGRRLSSIRAYSGVFSANVERGSFPGLDLMIVDEAHAQRLQTTEFIKSNPYPSGWLICQPVPERTWQDIQRSRFVNDDEELVEAGWLAPLRVFVAQEIDMTGAKKVAGEWSQAEVTERGIKITGDVVAEWVENP